MKKKQLIGLMSGTSMDGLDLAHVEFSCDSRDSYSFKLLGTASFELDSNFRESINQAGNLPATRIFELDKAFGKYLASKTNEYLEQNNIDKSSISAIASHGQTIFHQPEKGYTVQIGCGQTIAFETGIPVINDFRTRDVIAGGHGAPLVPIGDFSLFGDLAEGFLNIGGFTNVSFRDKDGKTRAFDICPGNLPLNKLVSSKGLNFDENGKIARSGEINFFLLDLLNSLPYYSAPAPKSLGTEWLEEHFYPLLKFDKEIESNLRTVVEHIAIQIASPLNEKGLKKVMITGGGAKNEFLIDRIKHYFNGEIIVPDSRIIDFKEAIIFAFLGYLYLENKTNCLPEVTGARKAVRGGTLHTPH